MRPAKAAAFALVVIAAFLAGIWFQQKRDEAPESTERHVVGYTCPMHPRYRSAKPGDCPSCGMRLVFLKDDDGPAKQIDDGLASRPDAIRISPERQQLIGVLTGLVEKTSGTHTIRVLGRVAVDETRVYRVNAGVTGWIREIYPNTVGSLVRKDQALASFYAPEFQGPQQAYLFALSSLDRFQGSGRETPEQIRITKNSVQQAADSLRNMGMGEIQIEEMARKRELTRQIKIYSPTDGFVLKRNVSPGFRFEVGTELYQIADLRHVWILADLFENEGRYLKPGVRAKVANPVQKTTSAARVSNVLPEFDETTRTLKVRLETDNPGFALRPGMFVDVEFPIQLPPALTIPAEAILDTGLSKKVFVDHGNGYFEPRTVETGWRLQNRVEITRGLMEGERIVASGNFLIDSESRLKAATVITRPAGFEDVVCGMRIDRTQAAGYFALGGQTYYFCSSECKAKFQSNPEKYARRVTAE